MSGSAAIAVVTPSLNQGQFIRRTIESVLSQGVPVEYFVADGGSTDTTVQTLLQYEGRLRFVSEKDRGQSHAVNKGISATSAPVIGWLNSDDVYRPGALETVLDYFKGHPECDIAYGDAEHIGVSDETLGRYPTEDWNAQRLCDQCFVCQPATFFRRSVVERCGLLDESLSLCMDYEYWIRASRAGMRFRHLAQVLAGSRMYPETKTQKLRVRVHAEINSMLKKHLGHVPARWIVNYAHAVVDERGISRDAGALLVLPLSLVTAMASLRWNHGLPRDIRDRIWRWLTNSSQEMPY